ncbi:uncharacterized protein LOC114931287 [Nylanderia fulva]|uniref:uncharacterized protein LOC114931287 n=1 Tax=Nylanderia fulva TaxID=613905 RepID=UPI0010FB3946|nr:uncharacterized protein LOC114931287 [Nylanderia fulva]
MRTKRHRAGWKIHCFGEKFSGIARSRVNLSFASCNGEGPAFPFTAFVYQKITAYTTSQTRPVKSWPHLRDLPLVDLNPSSGHPIHILIGADLYGPLLLKGLRQGPLGTPTAQLTVLGWIVSGPTGSSDRTESIPVFHCVSCEDINALLQKFWEDKNIPSPPIILEEDEQCEQHFADTHTRALDGRYVLRLPFKGGSPSNLGDSLPRALLLYANMKRRLNKNPGLAAQYHEFLSKYQSMGHMEMIQPSESPRHNPVYIPHHFVLRESSSSTKLRVVFNASSKTRDETSLNEHLMIGPKLQQDIASIILRWRKFCYVYTADVAKMFRQIRIHSDNADFQRILWRLPTARSALSVAHGDLWFSVRSLSGHASAPTIRG